MKATASIVILFVLLCSPVSAYDDTFKSEMKRGFDTFNDSDDYPDWIKATEIMKALGEKNPTEWLPNYWASYFFTQIARGLPGLPEPPKNTNVDLLLDASQRHLDIANQKLGDMTDTHKSGIHALQSLIYSFRGIREQYRGEKDEFQKESNRFKDMAIEEIKEGALASPESPVLYVLIGTNLLISNEDFDSIFAGKAMLLIARRKFAERSDPVYLSAHFNEQWVGFWISRATKMIDELDGASG